MMFHSVFYTLSLHDALPILSSGDKTRTIISHNICAPACINEQVFAFSNIHFLNASGSTIHACENACRSQQLQRSEEHTSGLQSRGHLVCRLLREKKKYYND